MTWLAAILGRLFFGPPRITHNRVVPDVYVVGHKDHLELRYIPAGTEGTTE